jgi:hypothetical protein
MNKLTNKIVKATIASLLLSIYLLINPAFSADESSATKRKILMSRDDIINATDFYFRWTQSLNAAMSSEDAETRMLIARLTWQHEYSLNSREKLAKRAARTAAGWTEIANRFEHKGLVPKKILSSFLSLVEEGFSVPLCQSLDVNRLGEWCVATESVEKRFRTSGQPGNSKSFWSRIVQSGTIASLDDFRKIDPANPTSGKPCRPFIYSSVWASWNKIRQSPLGNHSYCVVEDSILIIDGKVYRCENRTTGEILGPFFSPDGTRWAFGLFRDYQKVFSPHLRNNENSNPYAFITIPWPELYKTKSIDTCDFYENGKKLITLPRSNIDRISLQYTPQGFYIKLIGDPKHCCCLNGHLMESDRHISTSDFGTRDYAEGWEWRNGSVFVNLRNRLYGSGIEDLKKFSASAPADFFAFIFTKQGRGFLNLNGRDIDLPDLEKNDELTVTRAGRCFYINEKSFYEEYAGVDTAVYRSRDGVFTDGKSP